MLRNLKIAALLFSLMVMSLAGPSLAQITLPPSGVNIDVPFTTDPVCGFQIVVQGEKPTNFYLGTRNPWGNPVVQEVPPGSHIWVMTFGSPYGPCYPRSNPIFWDGSGHFLGLHFGFYTNDPLVHLIGSGSVNATCWLIGLHGVEPGPPVTGHQVFGWGFNVLNANAATLAVMNAQVAVSASQIPIDSLTRSDLGKLPWQPLSVQDPIVPGGSNDAPGTLSIDLPSNVLGQTGWGVVSYDIADPTTSQVYSTVTFEFPLQAPPQ